MSPRQGYIGSGGLGRQGWLMTSTHRKAMLLKPEPQNHGEGLLKRRSLGPIRNSDSEAAMNVES